MRLCSFFTDEGRESIGIQRGEQVLLLPDYKDMIELIRDYDREKILESVQQPEKIFAVKDLRLTAPVTSPPKMIFVGLNYRDHAEETDNSLPVCPVLFAKYSNSLLGHGQNVIIPNETKACDYEAELAVIIGKKARNASPEDAMDYVFGYTACNDVSARDIQTQTSQWLRGKAIDTFAPMGPALVTKDEIKDPHNLNICCRLNGTVRQKSNTKMLVFDIPYLISFISKTMTLEPGDIISTGTPAGVILGMKEPVWLREGDVCEVEIDGIGTLRNTFVQERK